MAPIQNGIDVEESKCLDRVSSKVSFKCCKNVWKAEIKPSFCISVGATWNQECCGWRGKHLK